MLQVSWQKCQGDVWGHFLLVDLSHPHFNSMEGVYVIWQSDNNRTTVIRVGQGIIKDRIAEHRKNSAITKYDNLFVTWAPVPVQYRDGVEKYLADTLKPIIGDAFPNVIPIAVNLP